MKEGKDVGVVIVGGENQYPNIRVFCLDVPRGVDTGHYRHLDIQYGHVGPVLGNQGHGLGPIGGLGYDLDIILGLEEFADAFANDSMVVGQDNADRLDVGHGSLRKTRWIFDFPCLSSYHRSPRGVNVRSKLWAISPMVRPP